MRASKKGLWLLLAGVAVMSACSGGPRQVEEPSMAHDAGATDGGTTTAPADDAGSIILGEDASVPDGGPMVPDVWEGLDTERCENIPGYENLVGASSYFVGEFTQGEGGTWTGREAWLLFATDAWEATGGHDCRVTWQVTGEDAAPGACGNCEEGMRIDATVVDEESDCPAALYEDDETYSVTYGVDLPGDGSASFYFAGSGRLLGTGDNRPPTRSYASEGDCTWF